MKVYSSDMQAHSWNHGKIYVTRHIWRSFSLIFFPLKTMLSSELNQVAQGLVQLSAEHLQGWKYHNLFGTLFFPHPQCHPQLELLIFYFVTLPLVLSLRISEGESGFRFWETFCKVAEVCNQTPPLDFHMLNQPIFLASPSFSYVSAL